MPGPIHIAYEGPDGRVLVTDSLTYCDERVRTTDVLVAGSYTGGMAVSLALRGGARGVIANAAGVGLAESAIAGLPLCDRFEVPAAAVSEQSARLADGPDVYENGVISRANQAARRLGIREGMSCAEAAQLMLSAPPGEVGRAAELVDAEPAIVYDGPEGRVAAMDSISFARPESAHMVVCGGSHMAHVTWRYVMGYTFPIAGIITSDAGVGKDNAGIGGLGPLNEAGVPAAAVASTSARVGVGRSTYEDGIISHCNPVAAARGVRVGQTAKEACLALLRAYR